jgi:hypothetical protein
VPPAKRCCLKPEPHFKLLEDALEVRLERRLRFPTFFIIDAKEFSAHLPDVAPARQALQYLRLADCELLARRACGFFMAIWASVDQVESGHQDQKPTARGPSKRTMPRFARTDQSGPRRSEL